MMDNISQWPNTRQIMTAKFTDDTECINGEIAQEILWYLKYWDLQGGPEKIF